VADDIKKLAGADNDTATWSHWYFGPDTRRRDNAEQRIGEEFIRRLIKGVEPDIKKLFPILVQTLPQSGSTPG
jgi:hypothetical protein